MLLRRLAAAALLGFALALAGFSLLERAIDLGPGRAHTDLYLLEPFEGCEALRARLPREQIAAEQLRALHASVAARALDSLPEPPGPIY